jgi:hypothetical protein
MVLGSLPATSLVVPAGLAVTLCALQDTLAYSVFLTRTRATTSALVVALILFGAAFPIGAVRHLT